MQKQYINVIPGLLVLLFLLLLFLLFLLLLFLRYSYQHNR